MPKEDTKLSDAKQAYWNASAQGNRQEEARWANVVGDILKNRGEYVKALKWLRLDYDVSTKYLPEKQVLPTCQSLGEVYLRLQDFSNALVYQKKHLELAKVSNDRIEQQRAYTQLGRTYHEIFLKSENDHSSIHNAKKYFKKAMSLAQSLREKQGSSKFFLNEYIDAHNNMGMLEMDLDNLEEARDILSEGVKICDEDEVNYNDAGRSRLHHNLGNVYTELRRWDEAREHIEKDIVICKSIEHHQGEAKGYINLGELHYRVQRYQEALHCYDKALILAKSMEDEDALVDQIKQNIETVEEAIKVMDDIKQEEQNLKKLARKMAAEKGTPEERKCLLKQNDALDRLIEKSSIILAWQRHLEFAKKKKRVATELCDKEKLSDAYLVIGESYQKLRSYIKALKWYDKSWWIYKSIGNLEGQALVKINIGNVMDSDGDWKGALNSFEEGHRIAVEARLPSVQLSALENMHYSHMIRFDNVEEASKLQLQIDQLMRSKTHDPEPQNSAGCCCSETDSEGNLESTPKSHSSSKSLSRSTGGNSGRKRIRVILSDDEDDLCNEIDLKIAKATKEDVATSDEFKRMCFGNPGRIVKTDTPVASKCAASPFIHPSLEESTCSHASRSPRAPARSCSSHYFRSSSIEECDNASNIAISPSKCKDEFSSLHKIDVPHHKSTEPGVEHKEHITFKIDNDMIHIESDSIVIGDTLSIESLKVQVACLYYLQLPEEKRSKGLFPIIQTLRCGETPLETLETIETLKNSIRRGWVEVLVDGWVQKRLMKLYVDCCQELSEIPNMKVLRKLYNLEVSEDEVIVSECDLQDVSVTPLLNALHAYKTVATLDLAHNVLGNGTIEKLRNIFSLSGKAYGGLSLDLHCNLFGPTSLFQICQCSELLSRLEVLNISGNRLTDACGSYLITILRECRSLYSLNIEQCSLTSRTIQKVADELDDCSCLSQMSLGHNTISGNSLANLLTKLGSLKRLSELNLKGLKLSKLVVDNLCKLVRSSGLPALMISSTNIGTDGALQLIESFSGGPQELLKLDWSYCRLTSECIIGLNCDSLICRVVELNLNGNPIMQEGVAALASMLANHQCSLRVLSLSNCRFGICGILGIIKALADNDSMEELYLADNVVSHETSILGTRVKRVKSLTSEDTASTTCAPKEINVNEQTPSALYTDCELEVADSEDDEDQSRKEPGSKDNCISSFCRASSFPDNQFIQDLSSAIGKAIHLRLLDLSGNGFSEQMAETLYYSGWLSARDGVAQRHITTRILHLLVRGVNCCGLKPCCKKDTFF